MNEKWILNKRPIGYPKESDFKLIKSSVDELDEGEILIESHYLSLDPYMRGRMNDSKSYAPSIKIGGIITGEVVGKVVESKSKLFNEMVEDNKAIKKEIGVLFKYL